MKGSVDMKRFDLIIVGAGPSGLSAAIEAAKRGLEIVVFDENEKPGGQENCCTGSKKRAAGL